VLSSGEPLVAPHVTAAHLAAIAPDPETRALIEQLGISSYLVVPLTARKRQLGALAVVRSDPTRPYGDDDLSLASSLAARAALAVDNARLYQTARAADQAKSDLIAVISHDLRTPLNSIIGYTDLLVMGVPDPVSEGALAWIRRVRKSAEHQVHLIDQLLTFSRLDARRVELRPTDVSLGRLLEDVHGMMEPLAAQAGLTLETRAPADLVVRTDPDLLRQVLVNLVGNALRYTERGGIRVDGSRDHRIALLAVSDTGVGIAPEHQERIFEPFWQVDPERRGGGTGLGLSIVRRLVELLGGEISVRSQPGRGSTFTVRLPLS
jgi:signal transduction histidine kinase